MTILRRGCIDIILAPKPRLMKQMLGNIFGHDIKGEIMRALWQSHDSGLILHPEVAHVASPHNSLARSVHMTLPNYKVTRPCLVPRGGALVGSAAFLPRGCSSLAAVWDSKCSRLAGLPFTRQKPRK